jgi:hypothetical protein
MRLWWLKVAVTALVVAAMTAPVTAFADVTDVTFNGGSLTGLAVNSAFSQGSFQNLSYRYEECGTQPAEKTCAWELRASLYSSPTQRCLPSTPESQLLLDSGERSGNGVVESGPLSFALEGCKSQILSAYYEAKKTFNPEEEEGPWKLLSEGSSGALFLVVIGAESFEEAEQIIRTANPPANLNPPMTPLSLAVSANCRSLMIGNTRYAFIFRRMGCRNATNLATMAHLAGAAPSGYVCRAKQDKGKRCWRRHHPEKYVEWRLPSRAVRQI